MPCHCELDLERRRIICRAWGKVTYEDVMTVRGKFASHPSFTPDFSQIYDGRDITRITLTASEVGALAKDALFGPGSRRAFVAPHSDTYGAVRTFKIYREINAGKEEIQIFRSIEDAEAWLSADQVMA